jgi:hypothetical protein
MLEIGLDDSLDDFFRIFKVESNSEIFEFEFISIIAADTDNKSKFLWVLNLSLAIINPFSLSTFE